MSDRNINIKKNHDMNFVKKFESNGKQGVTGIVKDENNKEYVFKLSQFLNDLALHEFDVMQGLRELSDYCPNFCTAKSLEQREIVDTYKKENNPFDTKGVSRKHLIKKNVLLMEYIKDAVMFFDIIKDDDVDERVLYSIIKQVLVAVSIAQKKKKFTHYDLHSNNIMVKKCDKNDVLLYIVDENTKYLIPSYGYYAVIIDFGFSYIEDLKNKTLSSSLLHTSSGFWTSEYDRIVDPKLLMVTVSSEIKLYRDITLNSKKLRRITKNFFYPLNIDWDSGWDKTIKMSVAESVMYKLNPINKYSKMFRDYDHFCMDNLQSLIILPFEKQDYTKLETTYKTFLRQWQKIEEEFTSPFRCLYIFKRMIDLVRIVRPDYINKDTRKQAVRYFKNTLIDEINYYLDFCTLKEVKFELLLCSIIMLARMIEGLSYELFAKRRERKEKLYSKLPVKELDEMIRIIDHNIKSDYTYNSETQVLVFDCIKKRTRGIKLDNIDVDILNDMKNKTDIISDCYHGSSIDGKLHTSGCD